LIYLATPYSHSDSEVREFRFREVSRYAAILMNMGRYVYSPISHSHPIATYGELPTNWEFWHSHDENMMNYCSELYILCLDGWDESIGVKHEIELANERDMKIEYKDELSLVFTN